jgi:predicted  nucleic acid-binding Zn-ribbon protein
MNIEETNLEAHVRICQERYESLDYKLDQVDLKFQSIDAKLVSIVTSIEALKTDLNGTKTRGFEWVIGLLLAILGFVFARFVFV